MENSEKIDFATFVLSISTAAFMGLGLRNAPGSDKPKVDIALAKQNIDLLELLQEKTKNNLTGEEAKLLESLLYETRMRFVEAQKNQNN